MSQREANFPYNEETALTMLYLEKQELSHLTPTQLVYEYEKVLREVRKALND